MMRMGSRENRGNMYARELGTSGKSWAGNKAEYERRRLKKVKLVRGKPRLSLRHESWRRTGDNRLVIEKRHHSEYSFACVQILFMQICEMPFSTHMFI